MIAYVRRAFLRCALAVLAVLGAGLSQTLLAAQPTAPAPAVAQLPVGGQVVAGAATIAQSISPSGATLTVTQSTQRGAIDWQSFNVGSEAQVNFKQPSAASVTLNRVQSSNPSQIFGKINANGQVFLTNASGIYFAPGASVEVGGLVATTASISNADFMAGKNNFTRNGATESKNGSVVNEGKLSASLGGYIALLAPEVRNQGVIVAQIGTVALAAGDAYDLEISGSNTLARLRVAPATINTLVENGNAVRAPGGLIILSARAAGQLQQGVVRNRGELVATGISTSGGRIVLNGDSVTLAAGSRTEARGAPASANQVATDGGRVEIEARSVQLQGVIDVSGANGGSVLIQASQSVQLDATINVRGETGAGGSVTIVAPVNSATSTAANTPANVALSIALGTAARIDAGGQTQGGAISLGTQQQSVARISLQGASLDAQTYGVASDAPAAATTGLGGEIVLAARTIEISASHINTDGISRGGRVRIAGGQMSIADPAHPLNDPTAPPSGPPRVVISAASALTSRARRGVGGSVTITGDDIALLDQTLIDASGAVGGGTVLVGGGWQGAGDLPQSRRVLMAADARINASATEQGDGGTAVLWSDVHDSASRTEAHGTILARGGADGGNGGKIETSGHAVDTAGLKVDAGAPRGSGGLWLIDPTDAVITQAVANGYAATLNTGTSVTNAVTGNIITSGSVTLTKSAGGDATLTLQATGYIALVNAASVETGSSSSTAANANPITITSTSTSNKLHVVMNPGSGGGAGGFWLPVGSSITTNGGDVTIGGGSGAAANAIGANYYSLENGAVKRGATINGTINAGGGNITIRGTGYSASGRGVSVGGTLQTSGAGTITLVGVSGSGSDGLAIGDSGVASGLNGAVTAVNGNISITGTKGSGNAINVETAGSQVTTTGSGSLSLTAGAAGGPLTVGGTLSGGSNLTLTGDAITFAAGSGTLNAIGILTVEPYSASFTSALSWPLANLTLGNSLTGLTLGKAGNTANVTISSAQTVAGPITVYGNTININADLQATASGADIRVTSTGAGSGLTNGHISLASGVDLTANNGDIVLWSNYAGITSGTANNEITLSGNNILSSGGGKIILAGGSAVDGNGNPTGYAYRGGYAGSAITLAAGTQLLSGGGDVVIRGWSAPTAGLRSYGISGTDFKINSGSGTITLDGKSNIDHAIEFASGNFAITSSNTAATAISITGTTTSSYSGILINFENNSDHSLIQTTGASGGGIVLQGINDASGNSLWLGNSDASSSLQILSNAGGISLISSGTTYIANQSVYFGNRKDATAVKGVTPTPTASSSDLLIRTKTMSYGSNAYLYANSTGTLIVEPYGNDFSSAFALDSKWTLSSNLSGLTLGKSGNTADITVSSAQSIAGPISIYGGSVALNAALTSTAAGAGISVRATTHITNASATTLTTSGGAVLLASNVDDATDNESATNGYINLRSGLTINTLGGSITLGGGDATGSGFVLGTTTHAEYTEGVRIDTTLALNSGGGNIAIRGKTSTLSNSVWGYGNAGFGVYGLTSPGTINSGTGTITIEGVNQNPSFTAYSSGIVLSLNGGHALTIASANTTANAIQLTASATGPNQDNYGMEVDFSSPLIVAATGSGGGITLSTSQKVTIGTPYDLVTRAEFSLLANSGPIRMLGGQNGGNGDGYWHKDGTAYLGSRAGSSVTSSASNITIQYDRVTFPGGNPHVATTGAVEWTPVPASASFEGAMYTEWFNWNQNGHTMSGLTIGKAGNTADITHATNAITVNGPISIYGGNVNLNANLTSTAAGTAILAKASGNVIAGGNLVTNAGNVTLWSDSDNSGAGGIQVKPNFSIDTRTSVDRSATTHTTGGGAITLAGGLDDGGTASGIAGRTSSDGKPDGYAANFAGTYSNTGVMLGASDAASGQDSNINLYSGGGDITVFGKSTSGVGGISSAIQAHQGYTINAGTGGNITLNGLSQGSTTGSLGFDLAAWRTSGNHNAPSLIRTRDGAISLIGRASSGSGENLAIAIDGDDVDRIAIEALGSGSITLDGHASGTAASALRLTGVDALAASGNISLIGRAGEIWVTSGANGLYLGTKSGSNVTASTSNILLRADSVRTTGVLNIASTGALTVEPYANSFSSTLSWPVANLTLSGLTGLTLGKSTNTTDIAISSAQNIAGPITIYGGNVNLNANLTSTAAGADILVKASGNIVSNADRTFQTNGGDLVFWSNSDAETVSGGYIQLYRNNMLDTRTAANRSNTTNTTTGGGRIVLAGGADDGANGGTASDGLPDGYALNKQTSGALQVGVALGIWDHASYDGNNLNNTLIYSGGGDIVMRGRAASTLPALNLDYQGTINSGAGTITLVGDNTGSGHGIALNSFGASGALTSITSTGGNALTPAISITGATVATSNAAGFQANYMNVVASGAGGISASGTTAASNYTGVRFVDMNLLSASGDIAVNGGSYGIYASGVSIGKKSGSAVTESSSNIRLTGDAVSFAGSTVDSTGTLTVEPSGTSFSSTLSWPISGLTLGTGATGLTLGKSGNTANVTIGSTTSIAGPITIYGGNVNLNANLSSTASGAAILVKASGNITQAASVDVSTNSGALTYWADSDNNSTGGITLSAGSSGNRTTITTTGGNIVLGGGSDPLVDSAWSSTAVQGGVYLDSYTTLDAATGAATAGDISLRGASAVTNIAQGYGTRLVSNSSLAGRNITVVGTGAANTSTNGYNFGIDLGAATLTASGDMSITGTGGTSAGAGTYNVGVYLYDTNLVGSGSGALTLTGTGGNGVGAAGHYGLWIGQSTIKSAAGTLTLVGSSPTYNDYGMFLGAYNTNPTLGAASGQSGNIVLRADKPYFNTSATSSVLGSGTLTVESSGNSFGSALTISNLTLGSGLTGLTVGKSTNTADITMSSAANIAGPITIYGGNVNLNANLNTSAGGAGGTITVVASDSINSANSAQITTAGANILFASNSDATSGGGIRLAGPTISSGGGNITMGGGNASGSGYAEGSATGGPIGFPEIKYPGIWLNGHSINAGGGNILLRGRGWQGADLNPAGDWYTIGIDNVGYTANSTITTSGSGSITFDGIGGRNNRDTHGVGINFYANGMTNTISAGSGAITLTGTAGTGTARLHAGINVDGGTNHIYSSSGAITLTGIGTGSDTGILRSLGSLNIGSNDSATPSITTSGNITLTSDAILLASTTVRGTGTLTVQSHGASFGSAFTWPISGVTLGTGLTGLTLGKAGNLADITIDSATSIAGPITIYGGNLAINAALTATSSNTITLTGSGTVSDGASGYLVADKLALLGGNVTLDHASNAIGTLAASGIGSLSYRDSNALTIGTVNPSGVTAAGPVSISTLTGDLTLAQNIATTDASAAAIVLNAGVNTAAGTATGGNIVVSGSPTLSAGSGGRITLYTGSVAGSTGVSALVGAGSGRFRYNSDETSAGYTSCAGRRDICHLPRATEHHRHCGR